MSWRKEFDEVIQEIKNPQPVRLSFLNLPNTDLRTLVRKFTIQPSRYVWEKLLAFDCIHLLSTSELLSYYALLHNPDHIDEVVRCLTTSSPLRCYYNPKGTKFIYVLTDSYVDNYTIARLKKHKFASAQEELASYANPQILEKKWDEIQQCLEKDNLHCILDTFVGKNGRVYIHLAIPYHYPSRFCVGFWDVYQKWQIRQTSLSYKRDEWDLQDMYNGHQAHLV